MKRPDIRGMRKTLKYIKGPIDHDMDDGEIRHGLDVLSTHDPGQFVIIPLGYYHVLSPSSAAVLSFLVNHWRLNCKKKRHHNGYVMLSTKFLQYYMPTLSKKQAEKELRQLEAGGWLHTIVRGLPARRFFILDVDKVHQAGWGSSGRSAKREQLGTTKREQLGTTKREQHIRDDDDKDVMSDDIHCPACRGTEWVSLGSQLRNAISRVRTVPKSSTPKKWAHAIRTTHTVDEVPMDHLQTVLTWYCRRLEKEGDIISNGNPAYLPVIFSGAAFRKKFPNLEAAMKRLKGKAAFAIVKGPRVQAVVVDDAPRRKIGW